MVRLIPGCGTLRTSAVSPSVSSRGRIETASGVSSGEPIPMSSAEGSSPYRPGLLLVGAALFALRAHRLGPLLVGAALFALRAHRPTLRLVGAALFALRAHRPTPGGPAKAWAICSQRCAAPPSAVKSRSRSARRWVTRKQKSSAPPVTRCAASDGPHDQVLPSGARSSTRNGSVGGGNSLTAKA